MSYSCSPGKSGQPRASSATTRPRDHMSIVSMKTRPNMTSGALKRKQRGKGKYYTSCVKTKSHLCHAVRSKTLFFLGNIPVKGDSGCFPFDSVSSFHFHPVPAGSSTVQPQHLHHNSPVAVLTCTTVSAHMTLEQHLIRSEPGQSQ